jgi:hypothetical protein
MPLPATVVRSERVQAEVLLARGEAAERRAAVARAAAARERPPSPPRSWRRGCWPAARAGGGGRAGDRGWPSCSTSPTRGGARAGATADRDAAARELRRAGTRVAPGAAPGGDALGRAAPTA